ncbi:hypothetical protein MFLAVUS_010139 [Mucor flavus]|uniref:Uncharacterized protein n=1 Tax=Mucor flavus TaxID=439312 RepID=A0ABP9ZC37_9FUNG
MHTSVLFLVALASIMVTFSLAKPFDRRDPVLPLGIKVADFLDKQTKGDLAFGGQAEGGSVSGRGFAQAATAEHNWYTTAIQLGWEAVTLRDHNIDLVKSHFNNFDHSQYFKHSHLIKKLSFEDDRNNRYSFKFSKPELLLLLRQLPNLNEFDFSTAFFFEDYLECLLHTNMQHITKIETGTNLYYIRTDLLFSVYYQFRNSITCIRLLYTMNTIDFKSQEINVIDSLTQFKKLTKLKLRNKHDINLTPFQIQDNCPNLEHLEFLSRHPISESAMQHILDDKRRTNLNFISSLTYLELHLPSLSATYTKYLVDYFPNQLTDLNIKIALQSIFNWIEIVGMEVASRLMEKAGGIDKTFIGFKNQAGYQVRESNENETTKYFKLLYSFMGTRQTHCKADFNDVTNNVEGFGNSFRYDSLDRLFVMYDLYGSDLYISGTDMMAVPDKTISIIGPEIFHFLEFNLSDLHFHGDLYRISKYSLSNCPMLQSLNLIFNSNSGGSKRSISLRHKNGKISSDRATCDMNLLQIELIRPSKHVFDLLTTHFHNIEIISLKDKDESWGYQDHDIDLTGFKKLKSFTYTSTDDHSQKENKFFLIRYTNGTERRIRRCAKTKGRDTLQFIVFCDISVSLDFVRGNKK